MSTPPIFTRLGAPLTPAEWRELRSLHQDLLIRIDQDADLYSYQAETDLVTAYRLEDLDVLRAFHRHLTTRYSTKVILHVVDILRAEGVHKVADAITEEMLEALVHISTAMMKQPKNSAPNTFKVCSMVVPHLERTDMVLDIINKRKVVDADEILALVTLMESGSRLLAGGVL